MASFNSSSPQFFISFLSLILLLLSLSPNAAAFYQSKKSNNIITPPTNSYIIHTDNLTRPSQFPTQTHWYSSIVKSAIITTNTSTPTNTDHHRRIFYTYDTVMHGFAATLTPQEAERVSETPGVIGVYEDSIIQLHTTRSPEFLGLNLGYSHWLESLNTGEDVIIGLVDTGIWPESSSFNDDGLPPVPPQWRGGCVSGDKFNSSMCNRKLIGARFFYSGNKARIVRDFGEFLSPRDKSGHGTHTASTAAGSAVTNANLFGFANGTARGMARRARLAMYKACWVDFCLTSDVMAAMDAAIKDGVHILSLSLGAGPARFYNDAIAIGAFAAVRNGIFVACSAGNEGWLEKTVTNGAPWIMTVGASSIDRKFPANVVLGNGEVYVGESLHVGSLNTTSMAPLVHFQYCNETYITSQTVEGKIVLCDVGYSDLIDAGILATSAGGVGLIGLNGPECGEGIMVEAFISPSLTLGYLESKKLLIYMNTTSNPRAMLEFKYQEVIGEIRAPAVAFFSSRGPHVVLPEILKPDIIAPGMNIIASWPTESSLTDSPKDQRRAAFNIISGTSMSCPHVAGIAALIRAAHPQWSPAMIRSAMMTTAAALDNSYRPIIVDENLKPATPLAVGAGHVDPVKARDPGLVYDAGIQDYIDLLCTLNYTQKQLRKFAPGPVSCSEFAQGAADLNYPSFVVQFDAKTNVRTLTRTLTKVSELPETYEARVVNPRSDKVEVIVEPRKLEFVGAGEKLTYKVQFRSKVVFVDPSTSSDSKDEMEYGYIIWENTEHQVKSPVVLMWKGS